MGALHEGNVTNLSCSGGARMPDCVPLTFCWLKALRCFLTLRLVQVAVAQECAYDRLRNTVNDGLRSAVVGTLRQFTGCALQDPQGFHNRSLPGGHSDCLTTRRACVQVAQHQLCLVLQTEDHHYQLRIAPGTGQAVNLGLT